MEQNQGDVNDIESEGMVYEENELQRNGSSFSEKSLSGGMIREPLLVKSRRTNTTSQIAIVGANVCPIESLDYEYAFNFFAENLCHLLIWRLFCGEDNDCISNAKNFKNQVPCTSTCVSHSCKIFDKIFSMSNIFTLLWTSCPIFAWFCSYRWEEWEK
ncbi:hypothetical protein CsSME_00010337 [Camellia sinensis var. sinensis]